MRAWILVVLVGCTSPPAAEPSPMSPADPIPWLAGFRSPCAMAGWEPSDTGVCSRLFTLPPEELRTIVGLPAVAVDPRDPDRVAVLVDAQAIDIGTLLPSLPAGPDEHWAPTVFQTEDGGRTWSRSTVPAVELFYGTHPGGDPHTIGANALFDAAGTLHVWITVYANQGGEGGLHAWWDDGWHGDAQPGPQPHRVAHAWEQDGHLYAAIDGHSFPPSEASVWQLGHRGGWEPLPGFSCMLGADPRDPLPRVDLRVWDGLPCPEDGTWYRVANGTFIASGLDPVACAGAWIVPLEGGLLSLGNADAPGCGSGKALVGHEGMTLQEFFGRPPDEYRPHVMGLHGDDHSNAYALSRFAPAPAVDPDPRPWLSAIAHDGTRHEPIPLAGPDEWRQDPEAVTPIEWGRCSLAQGGQVVWVACTEHLPGSLRVFRLELDYA